MYNLKCSIICSSKDISPKLLSEIKKDGDFIICADGGLKTARSAGIIPDLFVGDMDSQKEEPLDVKEKIFFPADKDLTDSHIAVCEALKRGYKDIFIFGGTGGRLDHEYANYCLLKYILKNGGFGRIVNENNIIYMTNIPMKISSLGMKYISFFPFGGDVEDFSVKNVKYELEHYTLTDSDTYTTSNEFINNKPAEISFKNGCVLIICSRDS